MRNHPSAVPALIDLQPIAALNTTPLIDVLLVLLIMLIVSIPMMSHKVPLRLPPQGPPSFEQPLIHRLELDSSGALRWDSKPIDEAALPALLATLRDDPRAQLALGADARTRYESYDRVLAIVQRSGIERLALIDNARFAHELG